MKIEYNCPMISISKSDFDKRLMDAKIEAVEECLDRLEAFLCGVCGSVIKDNPNLDHTLFGYNTEEVDAFIDKLRKEMVGKQDDTRESI